MVVEDTREAVGETILDQIWVGTIREKVEGFCNKNASNCEVDRGVTSVGGAGERLRSLITF